MDAFSEALGTLRITGAVFLHSELTAPWGFHSPDARDAGRRLALPAEHLIFFHLVTEGRATAGVEGLGEEPLQAGEIVIFPGGDAHRLWNGRAAALVDTTALLPKILSGSLALERGGGGGEVTRLICGYFGCERYAGRHFLAALPPVLKVNIRRSRSGEWIERSLRFAAEESGNGGAGRHALLSKLSEALFVETLSRYVDELPPERSGWLAAARDEVAGRALASIHRDPGRAWTLEDLAREAGASRSVLAERFTHALGAAPLAYLARWRLQLAARQLETTGRSVLEIATAVGYQSEAAFNRAFKREFDLPPARYRRGVRDAGAGRLHRGPLEPRRPEADPPARPSPGVPPGRARTGPWAAGPRRG
jgi:AraC-like DNA-binding protein